MASIKPAKRCHLLFMRAAVANGAVPAIETETREITRQQVQVWFKWMDRILDIHRNSPSPQPSGIAPIGLPLREQLRL